MADRFDAVLIGAGHNTLACALQLARKGWRVGLFEAAPVAGGAVRSCCNSASAATSSSPVACSARRADSPSCSAACR
jgi:glycine/D-amino acid oxidase-like deaminating enzyme